MKYILVHGTFDTDESLEGERWWQKGSQFWQKLTQHVVEEDIIQFRWSGENSEKARNEAAIRLNDAVNALQEAHEVTLLSHSHGGNVVERALNRGVLQDVKHIAVGTPFISIRPVALALPSFLGKYWPVVIPISLVFSALLIARFPSQFQAEKGVILYATLAATLILFTLVVFLANSLLVNMYQSWLGRVRKTTAISAHTIMHEEDEVRILLSNVFGLKSAGFGRNTARGSVFSVLSMLGIVALGSISNILLLYNIVLLRQGNSPLAIFAHENTSYLNVFLDASIVAIIFALINVLFWIFLYRIGANIVEQASTVFAPIAEKIANAFLVSSVQNMSIGQDDKVQALKLSFDGYRHNYAGVAIPVDIAKSMSEETRDNLGERLADIKAGLLSVNIQDLNTVAVLLNEFQWNELIHTYYFRHPECCQFIVDTVVGQEK